MPPKRRLHEATIQLEAGNAAVAELGKVLGPTGANIVAVKREYDEATAAQRGQVVPVVVTVFDDRSVALRYKTPPTSFLIRQALGAKGSARPGHIRAGSLTSTQLRSIAERKLPDLNTTDVETAMRIIAGTARSMGVTIEGG
ncbi:uL11 family ribosomal protein [Microtetraspora niveoalba]|uniref:uL11 family ribosomal protein n=1 Tax=Microtetraspora niveoalba TaxID=46175 RepID=UPI00082C191F|nr:50S ribosomal protein L11 [Microtetraspora niveoalba]